MFLGCPTVSPRPPNAADGATVVSTQNDKVAHCFLASHKRERRNEQSVRLAKGSEIEATMLLMFTVAAAVVVAALMDRHRIESSAAAKLKAASRKVDNSAAAVEVALKQLIV